VEIRTGVSVAWKAVESANLLTISHVKLAGRSLRLSSEALFRCSASQTDPQLHDT
jgi:hypothetical protein